MHRAALTRAMPALALSLLAATSSAAARLPFVGCAMDGQAGPIPAPHAGMSPDMAGPDAGRLAFYATGDPAAMGVVAPRGWHCFATYGSNGSSLFVTPAPVGWKQVAGRIGLRGPAIQLRYAVGDTSGRFEVAAIAARLFPAAAGYVAGVEREGLLETPIDRRPFAADRVTHRGPYEALFTTPAGVVGLGTQSMLAPDSRPIDGAAILYPKDDMSLRMLTARLSAHDRPLVAHIIAALARDR